jgi:hypothetical protein
LPEKNQKLLDELEAWCDQERVRRVEIAKLAGLSLQAASNWFAGRQQPTAEEALVLLAFLEERRGE